MAWMLVAALLDAVGGTDPTAWLTDPSKITIGGLLLLGIMALARGWVVPKPTYDALVKRCDALQAAADAALKRYQDREEEERRWMQGRRLAALPEEGGKS